MNSRFFNNYSKMCLYRYKSGQNLSRCGYTTKLNKSLFTSIAPNKYYRSKLLNIIKYTIADEQNNDLLKNILTSPTPKGSGRSQK